MNQIIFNVFLSSVVSIGLGISPARGQGTFQNLDFENGALVPIPGDPYGRVQWGPAMPGWTGYIGTNPMTTNQIDWILHNNLFLSNPGIAIWGPDNPSPNSFQGHYYVVLQSSFPVPSEVPAIAQTGTIPSNAETIQFITNDRYALGFGVYFAGNQIPLVQLGVTGTTGWIWGGDVSAFAGQSGELRFVGSGYLDFIQFSTLPIPEPGMLALLSVGALLLGWRLWRKQRS